MVKGLFSASTKTESTHFATNFLYPRANRKALHLIHSMPFVTHPFDLLAYSNHCIPSGGSQLTLHKILFHLRGFSPLSNIVPSSEYPLSKLYILILTYTYSFDILTKASSMSGCLANLINVCGFHSTVSTTTDPLRRVSLSSLNTGHSFSKCLKVSSSSSQNLH